MSTAFITTFESHQMPVLKILYRHKRRRFDPWIGKIPVGNGNPLQYSCLENSMVRVAWRATVHGIAESWTRLSDPARTHTHTHTLTATEDGEGLRLSHLTPVT